MKNISKKLLLLYIGILVVTIFVIFLYEFDVMDSGLMAESEQSEFLLTAIMELLSLGVAFLGLRLFKFKFIHDDLIKRKESAMMKWGVTRLLILEVPMFFNTLLYYLYMNAAFGYLAIILLLCLPFVFPSQNRCMAETTEGT